MARTNCWYALAYALERGPSTAGGAAARPLVSNAAASARPPAPTGAPRARPGNLPADLEGFRIVQLSDLHVGPTVRRGFVERVVATAHEFAPDLIALTGDVSAGLPPALRDEVAPLARLARRPRRRT